ncbi:MAG: ATPase, T2SS/T4P/T4SS family, partial [bacterium]
MLAETEGRGEQAVARAVTRLGFASDAQVIRCLGDHLNIPSVDLKEINIDPQVPHLLSEEFLRRNNIIPVEVRGGDVYVAMFPPIDPAVLDEIELTTGYRVMPVAASENDIRYALNLSFSTRHRTRQTIIDMHVGEHVPAAQSRFVLDEVVDAVEAPPIVRLVMDIVDGAIHERASDVHLEPQEGDMRVRYRIDGVLHDVMQIPKNIEPSVVSRIKILANLDITER